MKNFDTAFDDAIFKQKGSKGNEETIPLNGDLSVGGSPVVIGVEIAGPKSLFDCLDELD